MDIYNFLQQVTQGIDGLNLNHDIILSYDDEHRKKVEELVKEDSRYLYAIQLKCGIDPFSEDYYGKHDGDISIINIDHFGIEEKAKSKAEELRNEVYTAIDWVYNNKAAALEEVAKFEDEQDPFGMDWDDDDEDW